MDRPLPPPATRRVEGGDVTALAVHEWGDPDGQPILFLHGFTQNGLAWAGQAADPVLAGTFRLLAPDLRGHGASAAPADPAALRDVGRWGDDVARIIAALGLHRPLLVGWSYGAIVVGDYLAGHGDGALSGAVLVGGATRIGRPVPRPWLGGLHRHLPGALSDDAEVRVQATRAFLRACTAAPMPEPMVEALLPVSMAVPAAVRRAMLDRDTDHDPVWRATGLPVLIAHGTEDRFHTPAAAEHAAAIIPNATLALYAGAGHAVPAEAADRFNRDLAAFARRAW